MSRRIYQLSPQTIELLVALEGMGATTTNALAAKLERTAGVVEARLSALLGKRLVTVARTHRPRRYAVAPGWRVLIDVVQKPQDVPVAPPARVIRPAYSLPPGDGEVSARPWLTEAEADRVHELWLDIQAAQAGLAAQARARLLQKHALRSAAA